MHSSHKRSTFLFRDNAQKALAPHRLIAATWHAELAFSQETGA